MTSTGLYRSWAAISDILKPLRYLRILLDALWLGLSFTWYVCPSVTFFWYWYFASLVLYYSTLPLFYSASVCSSTTLPLCYSASVCLSATLPLSAYVLLYLFPLCYSASLLLCLCQPIWYFASVCSYCAPAFAFLIICIFPVLLYLFYIGLFE